MYLTRQECRRGGVPGQHLLSFPFSFTYYRKENPVTGKPCPLWLQAISSALIVPQCSRVFLSTHLQPAVLRLRMGFPFCRVGGPAKQSSLAVPPPVSPPGLAEAGSSVPLHPPPNPRPLGLLTYPCSLNPQPLLFQTVFVLNPACGRTLLTTATTTHPGRCSITQQRAV